MVVMTIIEKEVNRFGALEDSTKGFVKWTRHDGSILKSHLCKSLLRKVGDLIRAFERDDGSFTIHGQCGSLIRG